MAISIGLGAGVTALSVAGGGAAFAGHISTWDTTNTSAGSSNDDQIALPLESGGTYDFEVDWGDGSSDTITAWDDAATTHTYSSSGEYEIRITGQCEGFRFNNGGDRSKLLSIAQWGEDFRLGNNGAYFLNCDNLTSVPNIAPEGTTNMDRIFQSCDMFNADIGSWDVSNVTSMRFMLRVTPLFNADIGSWDVSNVTSMEEMFFSATSFDQDIGSWDITSVTNMSDMFAGATLSTVNYDALLTGWEAQAVQDDVSFHGGNSQYSAGAAATARQALIDDHTWTITDSGQAT